MVRKLLSISMPKASTVSLTVCKKTHWKIYLLSLDPFYLEPAGKQLPQNSKEKRSFV